MKSLKEISWKVDEATYRASTAISYSILSTYSRDGFRVIPNLYDHKDGEALRFGSLVDCLMTEPETLKNRFLIADFPNVTDAIVSIVKIAYQMYGELYRTIDGIPSKDLLTIIKGENYYNNYKDETKIKGIIEKGGEYYKLLSLAGTKTVMSNDDYLKAVNCIKALKTNVFTKEYFEENPFNTNVEKLYQCKFLLKFKPRDIRCMFDLLIVDHNAKTIQPCDLKTTGKNEEEFKHSFLEFRYYLQATLYSFILQQTINQDEYFKEFTIKPFKFIVINRDNQTPLIWEFPYSNLDTDFEDKYGNLYKGWKTLLNELDWYLNNETYEYPIEGYLNKGELQLDNLILKK
jgi:hypothetical protein